jgi:hypothetical protein
MRAARKRSENLGFGHVGERVLIQTAANKLVNANNQLRHRRVDNALAKADRKTGDREVI